MVEKPAFCVAPTNQLSIANKSKNGLGNSLKFAALLDMLEID